MATDKEQLRESGRVRLFIISIIAELLLIPTSWLSTTYGVEVPNEVIQAIATGIAGLGGAMILGRSYRNTRYQTDTQN